MSQLPTRDRWVRRTAWFLAISYGVSAPVAAIMEANSHALSQRFELSPTLIYLTCLLQFVCAFAVLRPRIATLAAAALCFTTIGAIGAHLRIGSPLTSIAGFAFTAVQIWFGLANRGRASSSVGSASAGAAADTESP